MKTFILKLNRHSSMIAFLLFFLFSCSDEDIIVGSNDIVNQNRDVSVFEKISTPSSINLRVVQGSSQEIVVSANDNIIDRVRTNVSNEILTVDLEPGSYNNISVDVTITISMLTELKSSGSGSTTISNFTDSNDIDLINSGSGTLEIDGSGIDMSINNSGSGDVKAFNFNNDNCNVKNSGSGSIEVFCNLALSGSNSGSGSIFYKGNASVNVSNTGSGDIINSN